MKRIIYLVDGVAVPKRQWERLQIWGEHAGAKFTTERATERGRAA